MNRDSQLLVAAALAAQRIGADDEQFAQVWVDEESFRLTIFRVPPQVEPAPRLASAYRKVLPAGARLVFAKALVSAKDRDVLDALVEASMKDFAAAGYEPTSWGGGGAGPYIIDFPESRPLPEAVSRRFATHIKAGRVSFRTQRAVALPLAPLRRRGE